MTSRCAYELKFQKNENGDMERAIRLRLVLQGLIDLEVLDAETFSGAARRSSQRLLASTAACKKQWLIASLDINMVFLEGLTYRELACGVLPCRRDRLRCVNPTRNSSATT
eukprot:1977811-Pyramimonas_sp.AAC.1